MRVVKAIVPAAGLSSRFGGQNKLLQPWGGETVVGSVVRVLRDCALEVLVVTGRDAEAVALAVEPARSVFNPLFSKGLGTSIAAGVASTLECDGFLVALGDMPGLRADVVRGLLAAFQELSPAAILAPGYSSEPDRPGHPVLFGSVYRGALQGLSGDEGARSVIQANRANLVLIPFDGLLGDLDRPEDF